MNDCDNYVGSFVPYIYKKEAHFDIKYFAHMFRLHIDELYEMSNDVEGYYYTFYIPKKNGGKRRIDAPCEYLKEIQIWILNEILYKIPCSKYAKAYIPGKSLKDNIKFHKSQPMVLTIDIKDFFSTIKSNHVYNIFYSRGYTKKVAVLLTKLCCYEDALAQGAPTSAYLSNLVMKDFDEKVGEYCKKRNIRYTRYSDDMTFSGNINVAELLYYVDSELWNLGLRRHPDKLKVMRKHNRQIVTGIVVNEKAQISREYRMKVRQEIYYIKKYGLDSHLEYIKEEKEHYLQQLAGKIRYALDICPKDTKMQEYMKYVRGLQHIVIGEKIKRNFEKDGE